MIVNKERSLRAVKLAGREFKEALGRVRDGDYAGALKRFQECTEYAAKAVLIAYGIDYPKAHDIGRSLLVIKEKYPNWFAAKVEEIARITDDLARERPRYRYPYEFPPEGYETVAREAKPIVERALEGCRKLIEELIRSS